MFFCLTVPKTSRRNPSGFQIYSDNRNFLDKGRIKFLPFFFRLTVPINFVGEPFCVSENFGYRKILCTIVISRFSVEKFLSDTAEKFRRELFCVSENFWCRKILLIGTGEGGSVRIFRRTFVSQFRKTSRTIPSVFQKCSGIRSFLDNRRIRLLYIFLSHTAQKLRGGTLLCFRNVPITKKFWIVGVSGFCLDFLSHSARKLRGGTLMGFRNVLVSKVFWIRGVSGFCLFLSHSAAKFHGGTIQYFRKFWVSKNFIQKKGLSLVSVEFFVSQCQKKL